MSARLHLEVRRGRARVAGVSSDKMGQELSSGKQFVLETESLKAIFFKRGFKLLLCVRVAFLKNNSVS